MKNIKLEHFKVSNKICLFWRFSKTTKSNLH